MDARLTRAAINAAIDLREQQKCARCGTAIWANGSRHHRKYRSRRGEDTTHNLILLCGSGTQGCHGWAHSNITDATREGYSVPSWADPAIWPIRLFLFGWVFLTVDGLFDMLTPEHAHKTIDDLLGLSPADDVTYP